MLPRITLFLLGLLLLTAAVLGKLESPRRRGSPHTRPRAFDLAKYPDPFIDPFYKASPSELADSHPGQVIRSRQVETKLKAKLYKAAFQVLYRTTDTQNRSEATVATMWEPLQPRSPPQILSYHSYMDSDSLDCDPSWAWLKDTPSKGGDTLLTDAPITIKWALKHGIYVVDPDNEGPRGSFSAGFQAGQAALDGMRATRNFFHLPRNAEVGMSGYSGGGQVTVWAANLAERYAPDLNIIGTVHGGAFIDARRSFTKLDGGGFAGFAIAALVGMMSEYPQLNQFVLGHIDDKTTKMIDRYRGKSNCLLPVVYKEIDTNITKLIHVPDPLHTPIFNEVFSRESLLMNVSSVGVGVPKFPRYIFHSLADEIIPFIDEKIYVDQQCQHGANIMFRNMSVVDHSVGFYEGIPGLIEYLGLIFNHQTPKVKCGTGDSMLTTFELSKLAAM